MVSAAMDRRVTNFIEDAETLGGIQIIIGCMHIGFGIILGLMNDVPGHVGGFASTASTGGYPYWGGISFIVCGSLSISASKKFSPALIISSLGMNIASVIFTLAGMVLLLLDMSINGDFTQDYWAVLSGKGISAMLLICSLLEFCISCTIISVATN
ncbi:membrane-spanning 4-domains subfamily A member 12-like [Tupaia chinensis]|uniref:membrane-spanning 4-domains subfamily A member 12-like n=1 Tax=Tupaia chinensis TaxID=246437 RepID=UPI000FFB7E07|nr:membrane-spanning 4-domains subfamily A member 12-like [Tupaia chinensis]